MKTEELLSLVAHYEMALGIEKDVAGMKGFLVHYLRSKALHERQTLLRYDRMKRTAYATLSTMMDEPPAASAANSPSDRLHRLAGDSRESQP